MAKGWNDADAALAYLRTQTACHIIGDSPSRLEADAQGNGLDVTPPRALPPPSEYLPGDIIRYRSKTEARYAQLLDQWQRAGVLTQWWYEPWSLQVGGRVGTGRSSFYRPDFLLQRPGTTLLECVEVKGSWVRDRALDKVKAAAIRFPCLLFTLAVWNRQQWTQTRIMP